MCSASTAAACTAWPTGSGATPPTRRCWCACTACRARAATSTRWRGRMAGDYRVVCPDVVGRGRSDWLADPMGYAIPAYVADMVTLLARLDADAGRLGRHLDGRADRPGPGRRCSGSPVRRLVLNDVGPVIEPAALQRIGSYLGQPAHWATLDEAADALWAISQGFGPHTPRAVAGADAAAAQAGTQDGERLQAALRPGHRRALPRRDARAGRGRRGAAVAGLRPAALPDAAAARRRVRPAVAGHGAGHDAARPARAAARVCRRRPCADAGAARPGARWCGDFLLAP